MNNPIEQFYYMVSHGVKIKIKNNGMSIYWDSFGHTVQFNKHDRLEFLEAINECYHEFRCLLKQIGWSDE